MPVERKIKDAWLLFVFTYLFLITQKLFWLARMLNEAERRAFVKKLGDSIETMLLEAKEVLNKC